MSCRILWLAAIATCSYASNFPDFDPVIDFNGPGLRRFQEIKTQRAGSPLDDLFTHAYRLGFCSFKDSPEIGVFIALLQDAFKLGVAVETGTYLGGTTAFLARSFDKVYTVEQIESLYESAREYLGGFDNIEMRLGLSQEYLGELLPLLESQRILFYLDAHGCGKCPLLPELDRIAETHRDNCIIVIDDFKVPGRPEIPCDQDDGLDFSHEYVGSRLGAIFSDYLYYYVIPRDVQRRAKFVALPKVWIDP